MFSSRTNNVVGYPCRAQIDAMANPKFPPPITAIRTGYGGEGDDDDDDPEEFPFPFPLMLLLLPPLPPFFSNEDVNDKADEDDLLAGDGSRDRCCCCCCVGVLWVVLIDWNAETECGLTIARIIMTIIAAATLTMVLLLNLLNLEHGEAAGCCDDDDDDDDSGSHLDPVAPPVRHRLPVSLSCGDIDDADFIVTVLFF